MGSPTFFFFFNLKTHLTIKLKYARIVILFPLVGGPNLYFMKFTHWANNFNGFKSAIDDDGWMDGYNYKIQRATGSLDPNSAMTISRFGASDTSTYEKGEKFCSFRDL